MKIKNEMTFEEFEDLAMVYGYTYTAPHITPREILDTYMPECLPVIKRNINLHIKAIKAWEPVFKGGFDIVLDYIYRVYTDEDQRSFFAIPFYTESFFRPLNLLKSKLKELQSLLRQSQINTTNVTNPDYNLAKAKAVPLTTFLTLNHTHFAKCPFHLDKTPSLKVDKHNRFHCFSCGFNGDTIDFYMKQNNVDFRTAVYDLNKM